MKHPILVSTASVLVLVATVAGLAGAFEQVLPGPPLTQLYPGPLGMANFRKIISGEYTGDWKRDAVLMNGSQPVLRVAPETFDTAINMGGPANDICTLPGVGGAKDRILAVGASGLVCFERDSANAQWIYGTLPGTSPSWIGAQWVAIGDLDANGITDIVGIGANGRDVLIEYGNADGIYTSGTTFQALGSSVSCLLLLNFRETPSTLGRAEIALVSPQGVEVRDNVGAVVKAQSWTYSPILATVISDFGTSIQRLATVMKWNGLDRFSIFGDTQSEVLQSLGALGVVSMASGDANGDGDSEVFLSVTSEPKFSMLTNRSSESQTPTYAMSGITKYAYGPSNRNPALNESWLAPGDFDSDGALDILAPAQGDPPPVGQLHVYGSVPLVRVGNPNWADYCPRVDDVVFITPPDPNELRHLKITFAPPLALLDVPAGKELKLNAKFWFTEDLGTPTDPDCYQELWVNMPGSQPIQYTSATIDLPATFSPQHSHAVYSIIVRQEVRVPGTTLVSDISPALTGLFTSEIHEFEIEHAPETLNIYHPHQIPDSIPVYGSLDTGPAVPGLEGEEEPEDTEQKP